MISRVLLAAVERLRVLRLDDDLGFSLVSPFSTSVLAAVVALSAADEDFADDDLLRERDDVAERGAASFAPLTGVLAFLASVGEAASAFVTTGSGDCKGAPTAGLDVAN